MEKQAQRAKRTSAYRHSRREGDRSMFVGNYQSTMIQRYGCGRLQSEDINTNAGEAV